MKRMRIAPQLEFCLGLWAGFSRNRWRHETRLLQGLDPIDLRIRQLKITYNIR